jgi:phosphoenolpyruvate phosphomutase
VTLKNSILNEDRCKKLNSILSERGFARIIEAHNGLSGLIGNNASITIENGSKEEFDGLWISSLTDSAARGNPDVELFDFHARLNTIHEIAEVTNKPIIVDGDTGRDFTYFEYMVKKLERAGVSAIIIEDKIFPKRNSLDAGSKQDQEEPERFAMKIKRGKEATISKEFMVIARIESLIAGKGLDDALKRARIYLQAGVDGIMIHSKSKDPQDIFQFAEKYQEICTELGIKRPLISVPTAYNTVSEKELKAKGFNVVIHANHLLRAADKAMKNVCHNILINNRSFEVDPYCSSVKEIFSMVGSDDIKAKDAKEFKSKGKVIILAAGDNDDLSPSIPCSMLSLGDKTILGHQTEMLKNVGLTDITVVRGFAKDQINLPNLKYYDNDNYVETHMLHSLMLATEEMEEGFLVNYGDVIFDQNVVNKAINASEDIVIVVDNSYRFHKHEVEKSLALIRTDKKNNVRDISGTDKNKVLSIGTKMEKNLAQYEFIGMIKFSKEGAENLRKVYQDCKEKGVGTFHEAESLQKAKITDMLQEMIDRGFKVSFVEAHKGWMEVHSQKDYEIAKEMINNNLENN